MHSLFASFFLLKCTYTDQIRSNIREFQRNLCSWCFLEDAVRNPRCILSHCDNHCRICKEFYLRRDLKKKMTENLVFKKKENINHVLKKEGNNQTVSTITFWPFPLCGHWILQSSLAYGQTIWTKFMFILKTCRAYHLNYNCNKGEQIISSFEDTGRLSEGLLFVKTLPRPFFFSP